MAEEILLSQPVDSKPIYALMRDDTKQPCTVALAYSWRPGKPFNIPQTDEMFRPEVKAEWDACGNLWYELMLDTYNKQGEFINIDFIGVVSELTGGGLGRSLLHAILQDADVGGQAVFMAASERRNEDWYARHGFQQLHYYYSKVPDVPGHCELTFMVRPPRQEHPTREQ